VDHRPAVRLEVTPDRRAAESDYQSVGVPSTLTISAVTDAPHRLLLSHFTNWSKAKGRDVDVQLLGSLLDLGRRDGLSRRCGRPDPYRTAVATRPGQGSDRAVASDAVVEALDAYFRFLRSTGRMAARSAMPAT
jgi:hypothetical protein